MAQALLPFSIALLILKVMLAAILPVFGDESYYVYWGLHPAGGYYDLPPMIGWWLAPLVQVSLSPLWIRLSNLLASFATAYLLNEWLEPKLGRERARWGAALYFFLPLPFLAVISFPDVPLTFFSFLSALFFYRARKSRTPGLPGEALLSGVFWGCAFLSKYFAVFLLPVFLFEFFRDSDRRYRNPLAFLAGALPFVFQHLLWNRNHCWSNFVFNLVTRQRVHEGTIEQTLSTFLIHVLCVSAPVLLALLFRPKLSIEEGQRSEEGRELGRFLFGLWFFPLLVFLATAAFGRGQGLHWLLFLTPFFSGWVATVASRVRLQVSLWSAFFLSGVIGIFLLLASAFPDRVLESWFQKRWALEYRMLTRPASWVEEIRAATPGVQDYFTGGYTLSSEMEFLFRREGWPASFYVWGEGSRFGRTFDWTLVGSNLEKKKIAIITPGFFFKENWDPYFSKLEVSVRRFEGVEYVLAVGEGFRFREYREDVLSPAARKFYPPFLPGKCTLLEERSP